MTFAWKALSVPSLYPEFCSKNDEKWPLTLINHLIGVETNFIGERDIDTFSFVVGGCFRCVPVSILHKYHEIYRALL